MKIMIIIIIIILTFVSVEIYKYELQVYNISNADIIDDSVEAKTKNIVKRAKNYKNVLIKCYDNYYIKSGYELFISREVPRVNIDNNFPKARVVGFQIESSEALDFLSNNLFEGFSREMFPLHRELMSEKRAYVEFIEDRDNYKIVKNYIAAYENQDESNYKATEENVIIVDKEMKHYKYQLIKDINRFNEVFDKVRKGTRKQVFKPLYENSNFIDYIIKLEKLGKDENLFNALMNKDSKTIERFARPLVSLVDYMENFEDVENKKTMLQAETELNNMLTWTKELTHDKMIIPKIDVSTINEELIKANKENIY